LDFRLESQREKHRIEGKEMNADLKPVDAVSLAFQFAALMLALGLPIWRIATTGHFLMSFLRMWLYLILWALLFCMAIPLSISCVFHDKHVFEHFPDPRGITATLMIGWLPCLILCSITYSIRYFWIQFRSRSN
jgi:hypothetical protein